MRISNLDHIVLNVQDVERSLGFYQGCLGLAAERVDDWVVVFAYESGMIRPGQQ